MTKNIFRNYDNDPNNTWYRKAGRAVGSAGKATGNFIVRNIEEIIYVGLMGACVGLPAWGIIYLASSHPTNPEYSFSGKIGTEEVQFSESINGVKNHLYVTREDGSKLSFTDTNDDLKLDELAITNCYVVQEKQGDQPEVTSCNTATYKISSNNPASQQVVKDSQEMFDSYLEKILETYRDSAGLSK